MKRFLYLSILCVLVSASFAQDGIADNNKIFAQHCINDDWEHAKAMLQAGFRPDWLNISDIASREECCLARQKAALLCAFPLYSLYIRGNLNLDVDVIPMSMSLAGIFFATTRNLGNALYRDSRVERMQEKTHKWRFKHDANYREELRQHELEQARVLIQLLGNAHVNDVEWARIVQEINARIDQQIGALVSPKAPVPQRGMNENQLVDTGTFDETRGEYWPNIMTHASYCAYHRSGLGNRDGFPFCQCRTITDLDDYLFGVQPSQFTGAQRRLVESNRINLIDPVMHMPLTVDRAQIQKLARRFLGNQLDNQELQSLQSEDAIGYELPRLAELIEQKLQQQRTERASAAASAAIPEEGLRSRRNHQQIATAQAQNIEHQEDDSYCCIA